MLNLGIPSRRSPLVRLPSPQLEIPLPRQRAAARESKRLHATIVELRHRGWVVYRNGSWHRIDGVRMTSRQLMGVLYGKR